MLKARKISFDEAWETTTEFLIDEAIENEIDRKVESVVKDSIDSRVSRKPIEIDQVAAYIREKEQGMEVVLADLALSQEKFMRIVSLLRSIGRVGSDFNSEWGFSQIKNKVKKDCIFATEISKLLVAGAEDKELKKLLPRYYLEKLNLKEAAGEPEIKRRLKIKD